MILPHMLSAVSRTHCSVQANHVLASLGRVTMGRTMASSKREDCSLTECAGHVMFRQEVMAACHLYVISMDLSSVMFFCEHPVGVHLNLGCSRNSKPFFVLRLAVVCCCLSVTVTRQSRCLPGHLFGWAVLLSSIAELRP